MQKLGVLLALSLALTACGGGGAGGGSATPAPAPAPAPTPPPAPPNQAPTAAFDAAPEAGTVPLTVTFDASASSDADGSITTFSWDFGDGTSGAGATVDHRYESVGSFTARLTVTDDDGASSSAERTITTTGFSVSGTIRIQSASAIDSDVNDTFSTQISNDDFASAEFVPNPATVGGYVAAPGAGPNGAVSARGDVLDVYRFDAVGGETIVLSIGDSGPDLDLRLFDATEVLVDDSLGITTTETVTVPPTAGTYFIEVSAFGASASTYVLNIGQIDLSATGALGPAAASGWSSFDAFVADQFVVGPRSAAPAQAAASTLAAPGPGTKRVAGREDVETLLRLDAGYGTRLATRGGRDGDAAWRARVRTLSAIKDMHASGRHAWVEPNWLRAPFKVPQDQFYPSQWHYESIKLPQAWDLTTGDPSVIVAVIDSGILLNHPDLDDQLVDGYDLIDDPTIAGDGDGRDDDPSDPGDAELGGSSSFHGTHVAGTIGAETIDPSAPAPADGSGVAGTAWNIRLMPLRALGRGGGTSFDVRQAMLWAGGFDNASGTTAAVPADIVNMSLGGGGFSQADQDVIDRLRAAGIIVIAAAGNESSTVASFPAAYDGVVSVSATTITDGLADYSNTGDTIDVAAPGGDPSTDINGDGIGDGVISAVGDDSDNNPSTAPTPRIGVLAGTSMAAPHVAGVAALMKSVHPGLTPEQFDVLLQAGSLTDDLGAPGRDDRFGHGLINAQKSVIAALDAAGGGGAVPGILVSSVSRLNFGGFTDALEFRLSNAGNGELNLTGISTTEPWLSVAEVSVDDATKLGGYRASVDRAQLPADGLFQASIAITSDENAATVNVIVQQVSEDVSANAGTTFVLLTAPGGGESLVPFAVVEAAAGTYRFELDDVPPGDYEIVAGSDSDNDGFICDGGESCGIFPTIDSPSTITIDGDRTDLDFVSSFRTTIRIQGAASGATRAPTPRRRLP